MKENYTNAEIHKVAERLTAKLDGKLAKVALDLSDL
jgi:hypothetical protein